MGADRKDEQDLGRLAAGTGHAAPRKRRPDADHRTVIPKPSAARRQPTLALCLALASTLSGACGGPASPSATNQSLAIGEWSGTTSQGMPIAFSVSQDEKVTAITVGYRFNSCSGTQTFSNLNLPTAPDVTCVPGPCPASVSSYRAFSFADGSRVIGEPMTKSATVCSCPATGPKVRRDSSTMPAAARPPA